jgi:hypothetical protein
LSNKTKKTTVPKTKIFWKLNTPEVCLSSLLCELIRKVIRSSSLPSSSPDHPNSVAFVPFLLQFTIYNMLRFGLKLEGKKGKVLIPYFSKKKENPIISLYLDNYKHFLSKNNIS